jgi:hypothetical protein
MVLVLQAWHFFVFAIPIIGNSKNKHAARKIATGILGNRGGTKFLKISNFTPKIYGFL